MAEPKFIGRLNSDSGNPGLVYQDSNGKQKLVSTGGYRDFAFYDNGDNDKYIVFSPYFEGYLPLDLIGVALKLSKV